MFIGFANFYRHFIQSFSKIAVPLILILKTSLQQADALPFICIDDGKVVGSSSRNNEKLVKFDFIKFVHRVKKFPFLTSDTSQSFT